jgi:hypothetical protein
MLLRGMRPGFTVHGFRSTFRDWAAEETHYPNVVCEMALGQAVGDAVEAAYRRGDLFERRRGLMADWGTHVGGPAPSSDAKTRSLLSQKGVEFPPPLKQALRELRKAPSHGPAAVRRHPIASSDRGGGRGLADDLPNPALRADFARAGSSSYRHIQPSKVHPSQPYGFL